MIRKESCIAGTGIILLLFWAAVFINMVNTPSEKSSDSWRRRLQQDVFVETSQRPSDGNILVLSTTLMPTEVFFSDSNEPIINDGVSLYAKLFFDTDPSKNALINRIKEKYGDLPTGDRLHPPGKIARTAKKQL